MYNFIKVQLTDLESIHFLNTEFVNKWLNTYNIAKSDPLDAQTISNIIATDSDVRYVNDGVYDNEKGYQHLKALVQRYYPLKKTFSQEIHRLVATCDVDFPELQYVFETNSTIREICHIYKLSVNSE